MRARVDLHRLPGPLAPPLGTLLALSLGALLALGYTHLERPHPPADGRPPARWAVADRDGGAVVHLDASLLVVERWSLPWPTHVRGRRGGGTWVVCALDGHPRGVHELRELDARGGTLSATALPPVLALETDADGFPRLLVRDPGGGLRCVRVARGRVDVQVRAPREAQALVRSGSGLGLVAGSTGFLVLDPAGRFWTDASATCGRLVLGASAAVEGWWLLVRGDLPGSERLLGLDRELRPLTEIPCSWATRLSRLEPGSPRTWALGDAGAWAASVGSGRGCREFRALLPALGAQAAAATDEGGLLIAAPGALLRLDRRGRLEPGQGGFVHLVDLAALEPRSP